MSSDCEIGNICRHVWPEHALLCSQPHGRCSLVGRMEGGQHSVPKWFGYNCSVSHINNASMFCQHVPHPPLRMDTRWHLWFCLRNPQWMKHLSLARSLSVAITKSLAVTGRSSLTTDARLFSSVVVAREQLDILWAVSSLGFLTPYL